MTSIFSGQLYRNFVKDQNQFRLENYDVNRFQRTIEQSAAQGRLEKELKEGLEYHQAYMADLQTKLNEMTEKLNNLYRRFMSNQVAFQKPGQTYSPTSNLNAVAGLPRVDDPAYPNTAGYPAGTSNIVPHDDFDKIRNFPYNPYFGSKAIDLSDQNAIRTYWEEPSSISEQAYRENGAFWSTISYLWGWDLDRINATYATGDLLENRQDVQINITALQPNKPQYPPLAVGDRFPLNWTGNGGAVAGYPAVNIVGLRPGGADYNHATDSINTSSDTSVGGHAQSSVQGHDSINMGWEFDDLPMALQVTSVEKRPDGTTVPTGYKVVYDIPPTHPHYDALKILNGTEPMIMDAPDQIQKDRIANAGFDYSAFTYIPGAKSGSVSYAHDGTHHTGGSPWSTNTTENEYPPPKLYLSGTVTGQNFAAFGGGNGTLGSPIQIGAGDGSIFGVNAAIELSNNAGATYPVPADITQVIYNIAYTRGDTGSGGTISGGFGAPAVTVTYDSLTFETGDYITFSNQISAGPAPPAGTPYIYQVTSAPNSTGFTVVPVNGGPTEPIPPNTAGIEIRLWSDAAATTRKYSQIAAGSTNLGLVTDANLAGVNRIKMPDMAGATTPIMTFVLDACTDVSITSSTEVSMRYKFTVHQNYKSFPSPGDDGELPQPPYNSWTSYDWSSDPTTPINQGNIPQGAFGYPIGSVNQTFLAKAPMGAGPVVLGQASSHPGYTPSNPGTNAGWFSGNETVRADIVQGANPNQVVIRVFFDGDLNGFNMEVEDVQIVTYDGNLGSWDQGKYNLGNANPPDPDIMVGDLPFDQTNSPGEVVNKYIPGLYQFTQFNDQYNNSFTNADRNDILRSPWEFAELQVGANSGMSGELFLDLNGRRLNLDLDPLQANTTGWGTIGAASGNSNSVYDVAVSNTGFNLTGGAVAQAHDFKVTAHPLDECIAQDPNGDSEAYQFRDSDPLTTANRNNTVDDEVLSGETPINSATVGADPARTANPGAIQTPNYYMADNSATPPPIIDLINANNYIGGGANDTTGTVDRIGASVKSSSNLMDYTISIPTSDVNVLRNENNLLVNLGSIEQRDMSINLTSLDMLMRTIPSYSTVPRYRVDAGGNIYDQFGKGFYDTANLADQASLTRLYTLSNGATNNGQVSNFDRTYNNNPTAYNTGGTFENMINTHDRFSMSADDYNLFDYTPDLNLNPASKEGATFGEVYVGSLPTNFYYYREELDNAQGETGTPPAGDIAGTANFNNDKKPAINIDGRNSNLTGAYNTAHTSVYNAEAPAFTNVLLGIVEQKAEMSNAEKTTTYAVWQDFPGLGGDLRYARTYVAGQTNNVTDPIAAVGDSSQTFASMGFPSSSILLDMGTRVNSAGYLVLNEMTDNGPQPHAVPLPLFTQTGPFPNYDPANLTAASYSFDAYGAGTVTRTGSKFMPFSQILDGADGQLNGAYASGVAGNMAILTAAGGEFATGDPAGTPDTWPNGVLLHVDDASAFDMEYPKNTVVLGTSGTRYRIMYRNTATVPQTMYLIQDSGAGLTNTLPGSTTNANGLVHADLQIRELTGTYTVSATNASGALDVNGTYVRVDYVDNGTQREGKLVSVGLSSAQDKVGRLPGDNPFTAGVETTAIGPEIFDSPNGYVQPDAQVDLHLVAHDKDGNQVARKLTKVKVEVQSGEQIIPADLLQVYSTFDESTTGIGGAAATGQPFDLNGGTLGNWPIAVYDGDVQVNPNVTNDLNFLVGYYQGITAVGAAPTNQVTVVDASDFKVGHKVTINGEQRQIQSIAGNVITLDQALSSPPKYGDRVNLGDGTATHDLKLFLNRSFAMSMGAGLKVTLEYEEYEYTGYPPTVNKGSPTVVTEQIGFKDEAPKDVLTIDPANPGTGAAGNGVRVLGTIPASYTIGDIINVDGMTFRVNNIVGGNRIELGDPQTGAAIALNSPPTVGKISRTDYEDYLVVGKGRSGGSSNNEFTAELKRIVDDPKYKDVFRMDLFKNIFITASINDPFNDLISTKLFLNWDRRRKQAEIQQASYTAYFKSI